MVPIPGFEPGTHTFSGYCSTRLSYIGINFVLISIRYPSAFQVVGTNFYFYLIVTQTTELKRTSASQSDQREALAPYAVLP